MSSAAAGFQSGCVLCCSGPLGSLGLTWPGLSFWLTHCSADLQTCHLLAASEVILRAPGEGRAALISHSYHVFVKTQIWLRHFFPDRITGSCCCMTGMGIPSVDISFKTCRRQCGYVCVNLPVCWCHQCSKLQSSRFFRITDATWLLLTFWWAQGSSGWTFWKKPGVVHKFKRNKTRLR